MPFGEDVQSIPWWQKAFGVITWPVMVLTPHGWVFLAASFVLMVMLGRHTPYSWAVWVTKWSVLFLLSTLLAIDLIVAETSHTYWLRTSTGASFDVTVLALITVAVRKYRRRRRQQAA